MLRSGFGTGKVKGSTNVLSKRTIIDQYPSVRRAFNSFPGVILASTTYTSDFAPLSGLEAPTWNNLFSDSQFFRQTNAANYPALNTGSPIKGNGPLQFVANDLYETTTTLPAATDRTYIMLFEYKCTSVLDNYILGEFDYDVATSQRAGGVAFYADSVNLGVTMRNWITWFKRFGTPAANHSQALAFGPIFPRSVTSGQNVKIAILQESWDGSAGAGDETLTYLIRDENLTTTTVEVDRTTVSPAATAGNWTSVWSAGFPAAYLRMSAPAREDISYYAVLAYESILSDGDLNKIIRMLQTMYGLK